MTTEAYPPGTARSTCVRAANPGPFTLSGTNSWVLGEPGADEVVVVDPGPDLPEHRAALRLAAESVDARIGLILLTHGHLDHSAGAAALAVEVGAPVLALDPAHRLGSEGLVDGQVITSSGLELQVVGTPGHTADSLSFVLPADSALLTGDTVLGAGTSVVAHPDGRLADYLASLGRLQDLVSELGLRTALPGHGPQLTDSIGDVLAGYVDHRATRLAEVRRAVAAGAVTADEVVALVYADVDRSLWPAAAMSVAAQLHYLAETAVG